MCFWCFCVGRWTLCPTTLPPWSLFTGQICCVSLLSTNYLKKKLKKKFYSQYCQKQWNTSVSSVQSLSHVWLFTTPWTTACQASLSITNSRSLSTLMCIELVMPSNHLILCRPLRLLPSIFLSIRVFSNELVLYIRWPKYRSFSFNISPSNEHPGLISFRMDWLDLLAVQGTLKSLLFWTIVQKHQLFCVQLSL